MDGLHEARFNPTIPSTMDPRSRDPWGDEMKEREKASPGKAKQYYLPPEQRLILPAELWRRRAVLALVFLVSFSIPIFVVLKLSGWLASGDSAESAAWFGGGVRIPAETVAIEVSDPALANPERDRDFAIAGWFKLNRLPQAGERMILASKYKLTSPAREGYAFGLSREGDRLRPIVYWRDHAGRGGWNTFSDAQLIPRSWFMFAVTLRKNHLLGVHIVTPWHETTSKVEGRRKDGSAVQLLGGYDLEREMLGASDAPLMVGAPFGSKFKGAVGALMVLSGTEIDKALTAAFKRWAKEPEWSPLEDDRLETRLYMPDGRTALVPVGTAIRFPKGNSRAESSSDDETEPFDPASES